MKKFIRKATYKILTFLMDREKLIFLLSNDIEKNLLGFKNSGYLYDIGWTNSIITKNVVNLSNDPIPWVTYPFIEFISTRINKTTEIFEYGSGNSTLYYANKAACVCSVENDKYWYDKIKGLMPVNVNLSYCELEPARDYCKYSQRNHKKYDLIIVDGRDRVNCCIQSIQSLRPAGVVILDDSEREEYIEAGNFLNKNGFKRIDFWGIAPVVNYLKCTTVFYKNDNCLGI